MGKLTVYGWTGWRRECPVAPNGNQQTREICATYSRGSVARIVGERGPWCLVDLGKTGNENECAVALAEPGVVFWCPLDESYRSDRKWRRADIRSRERRPASRRFELLGHPTLSDSLGRSR